MNRKILFVVRSKLGDTLINYSLIRKYVDLNPSHDVYFLLRKDYASIIKNEVGLKIIPFSNKGMMYLKLLLLRLTKPKFDILAILFGSGIPNRYIGLITNAKRKIIWDKKDAPHIFEQGINLHIENHTSPGISVINKFDEKYRPPHILRIPSLINVRKLSKHFAIGIVPLSLELRRNMDVSSLRMLINFLKQKYPKKIIRVYINPKDQGARAMIENNFINEIELIKIKKLEDIVSSYSELIAWFGVDTGLYHLAVSFGIPSTIFFGPTQPRSVVMSKQANVSAFRLKGLKNLHCDEKSCRKPTCLNHNISLFSTTKKLKINFNELPEACLLRRIPKKNINLIKNFHRIKAKES
jgi:ADP-heptose:LPS heptosyltransferase